MLGNTTEGSSTDQNTVNYSLTDLGGGAQLDSKPWDTTDPFFSTSTRLFLQNVLTCYVRQPIVFVGLPGNLLCCVVFLKQGLSDRINLLLFCLAVTDLTNLIVQLLLMPFCYIKDAFQFANWATIINTKIGPVNWYIVFVSGMITLLLNVDRCLAVVAPFKARRLLKYRPTAVAIFISYLLPLVFFHFGFLASTVAWRRDPSTNRSVAYMDTTSWYPVDNRLALNIMFYFSLIAKPVFLATMIVCSTITILHLRRASQTRVKMSGNVTEETKMGDNRITLMLLVICCAYIILAIPEIVSSIIATFVPEFYVYRKYHNTYLVYYQFIWIASCLNSSINFFPYFLMSSRFHQTLLNMCLCFMNKEQHVSIVQC